jgi:hypothetical protein
MSNARSMPGYPGHRRDRGVPCDLSRCGISNNNSATSQPGHSALPGPDTQYSVYAVGLIPYPGAAGRGRRSGSGSHKHAEPVAGEHRYPKARRVGAHTPPSTIRLVDDLGHLLRVDRFRIPNPPRTPTHFAIRSLKSQSHRQDSSQTTAIPRAKVGDNIGAIAGCLFDIDGDLGRSHRRGQRTRLRRQHARSAVSRHGDSWDGRAFVVPVSRTAAR